MKDEVDYGRELRGYLTGFGLSLALTLGPFALVAWGALPRAIVLTLIGLAAIAQVILQFRFFLHINLSRQKREDLHLILFSVLLLAIMAGGTIWIIANQMARMG
ncbi:cytochrome o ubiquinol oxidase subunit IV [Roseovarius sp. S1116L3]|uniref:cytochrome o ubiquinol oxidase subunit IV n=1 Tax=Roseovarius roseus TaxID=3342636 RepID=UPI00372A87C9